MRKKREKISERYLENRGISSRRNRQTDRRKLLGVTNCMENFKEAVQDIIKICIDYIFFSRIIIGINVTIIILGNNQK